MNICLKGAHYFIKGTNDRVAKRMGLIIYRAQTDWTNDERWHWRLVVKGMCGNGKGTLSYVLQVFIASSQHLFLVLLFRFFITFISLIA